MDFIENKFVLTHSNCSICVFGENGHYNAVCAHCPYCTYGKGDPRFMTREMAELVGIVKKKEGE